jgi:hypothetical protein
VEIGEEPKEGSASTVPADPSLAALPPRGKARSYEQQGAGGHWSGAARRNRANNVDCPHHLSAEVELLSFKRMRLAPRGPVYRALPAGLAQADQRPAPGPLLD